MRDTAKRLGIGAAATLALVVPAAAGAATVSPTMVADQNLAGNGCSLREAVISTNGNASVLGCSAVGAYGDDTIVLAAGTYTLSLGPTGEDAAAGGDLDIVDAETPAQTRETAIVAQAGALVTIDANGVDRVFDSDPGNRLVFRGLTIRGGDISSSDGGGIQSVGAQADVVVIDSTITDNSALSGGGIRMGSGDLEMTNSTVSGNRAFSGGGGLTKTSTGTATLTNTTVTGNRADSDDSGVGDGGGIRAQNGEWRLRNTIVAGNADSSSAGDNFPDCAALAGTYVSLGGNVIGDTTGCPFSPGATDSVGVSARLGALADNGGPTFTHALQLGSPAIDSGSGCPAADQRGVPRALGGACDGGAYELVRCGRVPVNRVGTGARNVLRGTPGRDGLLGLGGNDVLRGLAGNDGLCGGKGRDRLLGGPGRDRLIGGPGRDKLRGGPGRDIQKQ